MPHRPTPTAPRLAEEKSNFTAEGAPPPGKVATTAPQALTGSQAKDKDADRPRPVSGTIRLKRPTAARYP